MWLGTAAGGHDLDPEIDYAFDTDEPMPGRPPAGDVEQRPISRRQKVHQAFDGKACQLVMTKRGKLRLRDSQHLGRISLRELPRFKHLVQRVG